MTVSLFFGDVRLVANWSQYFPGVAAVLVELCEWGWSGVPHALNPHGQSGQHWRYSATEVPLAVCDENDPARTISYSESAILYRFAELSQAARYRLRVMYLSHGENRSQSLFVNGRELHGKLDLPRHQIVCREFDLPGSDSRELPLAAVKTRIAVDDVSVDSASPLKVSMPANGGFGVKLEGSVKEVQPRCDGNPPEEHCGACVHAR